MIFSTLFWSIHWGDFRLTMLYNGTVQTSNKVDLTGLLSVPTIFGKSKASLLALVEKRLNNKNGMISIATPNPEQLVLAHNNASFSDYLHQFDLLLPDGQGLVWASHLLAKKTGRDPFAERIAGREVVAFIIEQAQKLQLKVLVIGGRGYEAAVMGSCLVVPVTASSVRDAAHRAESQPFPLFWTTAYESVATPTNEEQLQLESTLASLKPDVVLVAFGAPHQEEWIIRHAQLLKEHGVRLAMVVGGSFDYLLGKVPKVPPVVSQLGLEWLFRLITQPWRWRRQLRLIEFIRLTIREMLA